MLLWKPWLSGNVLFRQLIGTRFRVSCKRIFCSSEREKFSPAHTDLGRLSQSSGICNEEFEHGHRCTDDHQWVSGPLFHRRRYRLSVKPYQFFLAIPFAKGTDTGRGPRTIHSRDWGCSLLCETISSVCITDFRNMKSELWIYAPKIKRMCGRKTVPLS